MTKAPETFVHYMLFPEVKGENGNQRIDVTPTSIDLAPNVPPAIKSIGSDELEDDLDAFIVKARDSMDDFVDQMVSMTVDGVQNHGAAHFGYLDLTLQLLNAPPLLVANALAACIASCAEGLLSDDEAETGEESAPELTAVEATSNN